MTESEKFLTPEQVSEILGVSRATLSQWRWRREGPTFYRIGGRVIRYRRDEVLEFAQRQRVLTSDAIRG